MRPVLVVVLDVGADHAPKLALIDRDHVIQAVAPQSTDPPLGKSVLPRGASADQAGASRKAVRICSSPSPSTLP
jgi:hypothetical protein